MSLKKFDYRIKDNRKKTTFLSVIAVIALVVIGVKFFQSYASFSAETSEVNLAEGETIVPEIATEKIKKLAQTNENNDLILDDGTNDHNTRYIGANPNNYLDIGNGTYPTDIWIGYLYEGTTQNIIQKYISREECELGINGRYNKRCEKIHSKGDPILWRIIGAMNNVEDENGNIESRVKIIRDESLFEKLPFDASCSYYEDDACAEVSGTSEWPNSTLEKILNDSYYNSAETTDPIFRDNNTWKKINFQNEGLLSNSYQFFKSTKYFSKSGDPEIYNMLELYDNERKSSTWTGIVGLMYPSDYGYATNGSNNIDRVACLSTVVSNWNNECYSDNWLNKNLATFTIDLNTQVDSTGKLILVQDDMEDIPYGQEHVYPVIYLKSEVKILGGDGSQENPFKLVL